MKKIYIKCVNGNYFEILKMLQSVCKRISLEKETFIIKDATNECYAKVMELQTELKSQNKNIIITTE